MARLEDFRNAGVRYIWVVDPSRRKVYELERESDSPTLHESKAGVLAITELGVSVDFPRAVS